MVVVVVVPSSFDSGVVVGDRDGIFGWVGVQEVGRGMFSGTCHVSSGLRKGVGGRDYTGVNDCERELAKTSEGMR